MREREGKSLFFQNILMSMSRQKNFFEIIFGYWFPCERANLEQNLDIIWNNINLAVDKGLKSKKDKRIYD